MDRNAGLELIDSLGYEGAQMADIGQRLINANRQVAGDNLIGESAKKVADFEATINGIVQAVKETREHVINHLESAPWIPR
ncbi:hypothetical protein [Mycobacteroides abscessus]|uniref:hypothetical protein n=1 Tax=Mycobacteroides abscessus TaxID=36809 RepID=UPI00092C35BD|nr:hypothetical protein [Mycobacteroides abscessus]MBN7332939.1 hypothetical protein [Mycobacteroides abscessus subsp. abscessus]MDB2197624.1 hypothetical protein [Mycobacteroides abscessus subsp. abscessus]MDB2202000.1 hypothetical protein [Mycobacteroides abscessus subsp. abscessus]QSM41631.1 hypothetical protein IN842_14895 [Mycobacteroides abscessus subsp. abscessus]SHP43758.1 Uncharacterised protein [Mycobacteroides abscessus subsp. abscessus]